MKHKYPLLWCLLLLLPFYSFSQNCGLDSALTMPFNDTIVYRLEVFDVINNDLADPAQAVCDIEIQFRNQEVSALEMWLVSPGGDSVQLVGPKVTGIGFGTLGSIWDITFLNDNVTPVASPDFPYGSEFDNRLNMWLPNLYTGSYFPFMGSLADFNQGTVNGDWQLVIHYDPQTILVDDNFVTAMRINFCDARGYDCCFVDAGSLPDIGPINACAGDTSLNLTIDPIYTDAGPDTSIYAYTYVIGEGSLLFSYDSLADFSQLAAGTYQICGLSYQRDQRNLFPLPDAMLTIDSLRNNLLSVNPLFCGELTDTCIEVTVLGISDTTFLGAQLLCEGDTLQVGDSSLTQAGQYFIPLRNQAGCDSIVEVDLNINVAIRDTISESACSGMVHISATGVELDTTGFYPFTYTAASTGCDSIVVVDFTRLLLEPIIIPERLTLTCTDREIILDGSQSTPRGLITTYRWEIPPYGDIISRDSILVVNSPGDYYLQVERAKDGISCARRTGPVTIIDDIAPPNADAGNPDSLTCITNTITLDGSGSDTGNHLYQWSTFDGGNILNDTTISPIVDAIGTYQLVVTDTLNGCQDTSFVQIGLDTLPPIISGLNDTTLSCNPGQIRLNATTEVPASFNWSASSGRPITDGNTASPLIDFADSLTLVATALDNGCQGSLGINVGLDTAAPMIVIASPPLLDCQVREIQLDASASDQDPNLIIEWQSSMGGSFLSGENTLQPTINSGGLYTLILRDTLNGCSSSASVMVTDTARLLDAVIFSSGTLTCDQTQIFLLPSGSSVGPNISYQWTDLDHGNFSGLMADSVAIDRGGRYQLIVQDDFTKCINAFTLNVEPDTISPMVDAGLDQELTCSITRVRLSGSGSASGNFDYQWSGPGIVSDSNVVDIEVDAEGVYTLSITDLDNGCVASDLVEVTTNPLRPEAIIADTFRVDCISGEALLDASASSGGSVEWFFGGFPLGSVSDVIAVNRLGTYTVRVVNNALGCVDEKNVEVIQDCAPEILLAPMDTLNCGVSSISIDASPSQGEGLSFQWSGPGAGCINGDSTSAIVEVNCPGIYEITVINTFVSDTSIAQVEVFENIAVPNAFAGPDDTLSCAEPSIQLDASINDGGDYSYNWSTIEGISVANTASLDVNIPISLVLIVQDNRNSCASLDTVTISGAAIPDFQFRNPDFLSCKDSLITLEIINNGPDSNLIYQWFALDGQNIQNTNGPSLEVNTPGAYALEVTNTQSSCTLRDTLLVSSNFIIPVSNAGQDQYLNCNLTSVSLDGSNSDQGPNIQYQWLSPRGGTILGEDTSSIVTVLDTGTYQLLVLDTSNGCFDLDSVAVLLPLSLPTLPNLSDQILTCLETSFELEVPLNEPSGYSITWEAEDFNGSPITVPDELLVTVDEAGIYTFIIIDDDTGCQDSLSVIITSDQTAPVFSLDQADTLTCDQSSLTLSSSPAFPNPDFLYNWSSTDPNFTSTDTAPNIVTPGAYFLNIENQRNGCIGRDTIEVMQDIQIPSINIIGDSVITCLNPSLQLEGNSDISDPNFMWTGPGLNAPEMNAIVNLDQAGVYQLTIINPSNGCSNVLERELIADQALPILQLDTSDLVLGCDQNTILLDASASSTASGTTPVFSWTGSNLNSDQSSISVMQAQMISLILRDTSNGCTVNVDLDITQDVDLPMFSLSNDGRIGCGVNEVQLSANFSNFQSDFQLNWLDETGNILGSSDQQTVMNAGNYTLQVNNPSNGCSTEQSIEVLLNDGVPQLAINVSANLDCDLEEVEIIANSSNYDLSQLMLSWSTAAGQIIGNASSGNIRAGEAGIYTLTAVHAPSNCSTSQAVEVLRSGRGINGASIEVRKDDCDVGGGGSLLIGTVEGGTGPYLYDLNGSGFMSGNNLTIPGEGTYSLIVQDIDGCTWDTLISLEANLLPTVDLGMDLSIEQGDSVQLNVMINSGNYTELSWINDNTIIASGTESIQVSPDRTATYVVRTSDANGCIFEDAITIFVEKGQFVFVPTAFSPNGDGVNDLFQPGFNEKVRNIKLFHVFDRWGNVVFTAENRPPGDLSAYWDGAFAGELAPSGVYVYWLEVELLNGEVEMERGEVLLIR